MNVTAAAPSMRRAVRRASPAAVSTKVRSNRDARPDRVRKTLDRRKSSFFLFRTLFVTGRGPGGTRAQLFIGIGRSCARDGEKRKNETSFSAILAARA
jgi:hypothetical protein